MRLFLLALLLLVAAAALAWRPAARPVLASGETCPTPPRDFPFFQGAVGAQRPPLDLDPPGRLETATFAVG